MNSNKSIIEHAVFEVLFDTRDTALAHQDSLVTLCYDSLLPIIDNKFNEISIAEQEDKIVIDYLELDLGDVDANNLKNELEFKLRYELDRCLKGFAFMDKHDDQAALLLLLKRKGVGLSRDEVEQLIDWLLSNSVVSMLELAKQFDVIHHLFLQILALQPAIIYKIISSDNKSEKIVRVVNLTTAKQLQPLLNYIFSSLSSNSVASLNYLIQTVAALANSRKIDSFEVKSFYRWLLGYCCAGNLYEFSVNRPFFSDGEFINQFIKVDRISDIRLYNSFCNCLLNDYSNTQAGNKNKAIAQFLDALKHQDPQKIKRLWERLITDDPQMLVDLIKQYSDKIQLFRLISNSLSDLQLLTFINHLNGQPSEMITSALTALTALMQIASSQEEHGKASRLFFWNCTLTYLFIEQRTLQNQQNYLSYLFNHYAAVSSYSYIKLLKKYQQQLENNRNATRLKVDIDCLLQDKLKKENNVPQQINSELNRGHPLFADFLSSKVIDNKKVLERFTFYAANSPEQLATLFDELKTNINKGYSLNRSVDIEVLQYLVKTALKTISGATDESIKLLINSATNTCTSVIDKKQYYALLLNKILNGLEIDLEKITLEAAQFNELVSKFTVEDKKPVLTEQSQGYFEAILLRLFTQENVNISTEVYLKMLTAQPRLITQYFNRYLTNSYNRSLFCRNIDDEALLETCSALYAKKYDTFLSAIIEGSKSQNSGVEFKAQLWSSLLSYFLEEQNREFNDRDCLAYIIKTLSPHNRRLQVTEGGSQQLDSSRDQLLQELVFNQNVLHQNSFKQLSQQVAATLNQLQQQDKKLISEKQLQEINQQQQQPNIAYIQNAGLVLLTPYIPQLFAIFELTDNGQFIDNQCREKAINILQYLVSSASGFQDHELSLNKLICGFQLNHPVAVGVELSAQQKATIDSLLKGVISHWQALGETSVAGLQESFICRDGELLKIDEHWLLQVMPKAFDMLIDQLPWGFSTIKYSWMPEMIQVKWRN